ncbi:MAG: hypothetical protein L0Y71_14950 [Gemmataceae bacterium]|nr:hypothetical protein [Gemmataceae bacterium]
MSVALECLDGDVFYCMDSFHACPRGEPFSWKRSRRFEVGDSLRFVRAYLDEHFKEHPSGWMIVFKAADDKEYAATQTYFATAERWNALKQHFTQRQRRPRATSKSRVVTRRPTAPKKQPAASGSKKRRIAG